jgi:hypothetical protein
MTKLGREEFFDAQRNYYGDGNPRIREDYYSILLENIDGGGFKHYHHHVDFSR